MRHKLYQLGLLLLILGFLSFLLNYPAGLVPLLGKSESIPEQAELTYGLAEPVKTLDPSEANNLSEAKVLVNLFEGLVRYKPNSTEIEPALATSWNISEDGRSWTFHLRPDVFFHDNTPFTAAAVKFSVERQLKPLKKDTMTYGSFTFGMVESVEVVNDYTVKINLKAPFAPFLRNLAMPWAAPIVSPAAVAGRGEEFYKNPVGTGPYYLAGWRKGSPVLKAYQNYWGPKAKIKSIAFTSLPPDQRLSALLSGETGLADIIEQQKEQINNKTFYILSQPAASLGYLGMFNNRPPFNNEKVRRAVCMAVDRSQISEELYSDTKLSANSILPPKIFGYSPDLKPYSGGPAKAKALLSAYGYPDGLDITLVTYDCPRPYNPLGGKVLADLLKKQLARAGIRVMIKSYPWHQFKTALLKQEGDAFLFGWVGDNMDPDNFLYTLLSSDQGSQTNLARYRNSEVDRLISAAQKEHDEVVRKRLYFYAQQIVLQDTPVVFLNYGKDMVALREDIKGVELNPYGLPLLYSAYIDQESK